MDLLDLAIIDEVRDALGDDAYRGYADRMLAEMRGLGAELDRHLAAGGFEALAQTAHRAAGSAASVGAKGLHAALKGIEEAARKEGAAKGLPDLLRELSRRIDATEAAISALIGEA